MLYDGKYHDVDQSDMAFKIAGSLAFKEAMKQARPALLEPVMHVEVYAPDQYSGDIMGDLSSRRGRISGSEARGPNVVVKAQVPFAEMLNYATDLTSMTQGRATYSMEYSHYDYVPSEIADKVIAAHKPSHGEPWWKKKPDPCRARLPRRAVPRSANLQIGQPSPPVPFLVGAELAWPSSIARGSQASRHKHSWLRSGSELQLRYRNFRRKGLQPLRNCFSPANSDLPTPATPLPWSHTPTAETANPTKNATDIIATGTQIM